MKKIMRIGLSILLAIVIVGSIGWYLFVYDRNFTRDLLLQQARFHDLHGNARFSSWFYDLAYNYSGKDENVAIELANQYKKAGNYTKAESTLSNAIKQGPTVELYTALSRVYAEQNKLMDSVSLLNKIPHPQIKAQLDALRPQPPQPDHPAGFYSQYIDVALNATGTVYYTLDGTFPSTDEAPYTDPIPLNEGETMIRAVSVDRSGLVSEEAKLNYTVGGVIEAVTLNDPALDAAVRQILGKDAGDVLYTNDLWQIKELTVPEGAQDLSELAKIPYMKKLTISGYPLENLTFLTGFTALESLDLSGCRVAPESLEVLAGLPSLRELRLAGTGLSTIAGLGNVQNLVILDLSGNTVRNLEPLSHMITLQELNLTHNALTDLSALTPLTELQKLDVSFNSLTSLAPVASCSKLTWLDAGNNQLDSLSGVESLPMLNYLSGEFNKLTDISLLSANTELETLKLANNELSDISVLGNLVKLDSLYFSHNAVTTLPQWPDGSALRIIDGAYNQIASVENLRNMTGLSYVYLDYNALTSIDPITGCYNLVQVNVYGNEIDDVSALTKQDIIVNFDPT